MLTLKWSKWVSLFKLYELKNETLSPPLKSGVYKIKCVRNGKDILIKRAKSVEDEILYIGETSATLKKRINDFWKAANENPNNIKISHSGGNTYVLFNIQSRFPLRGLQVKWAITSIPKAVEKRLLNNYKQKTFDIPPLNIKLGRVW